MSDCNQVEMIERFHQRVICQRQEREAGQSECQHEGTGSGDLCVCLLKWSLPQQRNIDKAPAVGYLFANLKKKINLNVCVQTVWWRGRTDKLNPPSYSI